MAKNKDVEKRQSKKDSKETKPKRFGLKPKGAAQWYKGRLCPIRKTNAWFMKPKKELPEGYATTKDVFMHPNYISQFILPVLQGDILEFILSDRNKTKPMAHKVRVSQYMPRTCKELIEYMRALIEGLNNVDFKKVLVQVLPCTAMWRFLGSPKFKGKQDEGSPTMTYVEVLLTLLKLILRLGKPYKSLLQDVIKNVTRGTMFQSTSDQNIANIIKSCNYADGNLDLFYSEVEKALLSAELVRSFCHDAIHLSPTVTRCLLPTVNAISEKVANPSTQSFLCDLLSLNSVGENSFVANAAIWKELPLIPTDHELAGHLVERDKHLLPVRTTTPYDNPDQYMDTYFRLVRAETFSAIQHGIKDLKASQLDLRDMNVYSNIHLAGFELQGGRFSLAIHFTPTKKVKRWEASTQLMYGNLVCISINRKFDDVIWATVSNRDADLLNIHQVIMLELLDDNSKSTSEIMISLQTQGGSAIMVESPTYFHSLSPILRSLKEFDMEDFALKPDIIYAKPSREMPSYLKGATCQTSIVCSTNTTVSTLSEEGSEGDSEEGETRDTLSNYVSDDKMRGENFDAPSNYASDDKMRGENFEALSNYSSDDKIRGENFDALSNSSSDDKMRGENFDALSNYWSDEEMPEEDLGAFSNHSSDAERREGDLNTFSNCSSDDERREEDFKTFSNCSSDDERREEDLNAFSNYSTDDERREEDLNAFSNCSSDDERREEDFKTFSNCSSDDERQEEDFKTFSNCSSDDERREEDLNAFSNYPSDDKRREEDLNAFSNYSSDNEIREEYLNALASYSSDDKIRKEDLQVCPPQCSLQCNSNADQPSAETSNADTGSHKKLGKRKEVERFVEIFGSGSESSLEASQCEALTHALKNKLAIIQGPPGCGKTFIGVKIVQLLLSLKPKLEKPILLLTYKNHALDEFLKHTLTFCDTKDLVRIGGRSKERILEKCNLKAIQSFIVDKPTYIEVQNTINEICEIEQKIETISAEVETSSFLTQRSLIEELTEEQIGSLMVEAGWGRRQISYKIRKGKFADKLTIELLISSVSRDFRSLKEFLLRSMQTGVNNDAPDAHVHCYRVFRKAFRAWFPNRVELQRMKQIQSQFILQAQSDTTTDNDDETKDSKDGDNDELGDEEHVKQLLEARMGSRYRGGSVGDLVLFKTAKTKRNDILVEISDYPPDMAVSSQIRSVNNLWNLNEAQRLQFLYCILNEKTTSVFQEMNGLLEQLQSLKNRKQELEMNDKVEMLSQKKIIGVTITGASINHDLIHHIGPSVVIVEEAAEILEPSLLAALTPSIEHLILIGDHKQLRPQVDTYELCKNFQLDVSMMERLIESGFPFRSLVKQNRMRPEFSALLHDIYPKLEDNLPLVLKNEPLKCIGKSMFFWSHSDPEKCDRTYTNVKEADRIVALVLYLLNNGCPASEITVLAAYLGQTRLLRHMLKQEKVKRPELFQRTDDREGFVQVQTIDMYQGDENKYVLVSLVRSNNESRIGFLNKMNRRCVAQSRAKCGLYFVGNFNTLVAAKDSCWTELLTAMMQQDCVANEFPLQCVKHVTSKYPATDAKSIHEVIASPKLLCMKRCGDLFPECEHPCKKPCFERHLHNDCPEIVSDHFPDCGHAVKRRCPKRISSLRCDMKVIVDLPCGHECTKLCYQNVSEVLCIVPVIAIFARCGHSTEKECYEKIEYMTCRHLCEEMNSCGIHKCSDICGDVIHKHEQCPEMVDYNFPKCDHPSSMRKRCSEEINWKCKYKVHFTGACGHVIEKKCHQTEDEVKCPFKPCERTRKCGHPCKNACGEDCEKGECDHCLRVWRKKMEEFRRVARERVKELEEKLAKKEIPRFSKDEIHSTGASAAEYQKVVDQVLKYIQPCHNWFPRITKIEKVTNLNLEKKFEAAKSKAFGDYIDTKFHGSSNKSVRGIARDGFKMPEAKSRSSKKPGMYDQGIYFVTDSSKSAQDMYTKGSQTLLLCQVILGKSLTAKKADHGLNKKRLRSNGYDSVYAPRGTAVKNDEFVIFDPDQALPQYIIHFSDTHTVLPPSPKQLSTEAFLRKNIQASRTVNFQDPFEMYYNFAESHFRRMAAKSTPPLSPHEATITSIDIVINKDLEDKFEDTKKKFKSQGIPDVEVLAYHGTNSANIDSILKDNLQLSYAKRQLYGKGNYFSEFPRVSLGYGDGLLLCRILPGKEFVDSASGNIPTDYNSKKVLLSGQASGAAVANASGKMIIIENSDQILPFFVIHRK